MTALTKPAPAVATVKRDIDRLFERLMGGPLFEPFFAFEPMAPVLPGTAWIPAVDLEEYDKEYVIRLEAPGLHKENLDLNLMGQVLTITGRREEKKEKAEGRVIWQEREMGAFTRTIRLPAPVVENKIEANFQDGILTVHLPKVTPAVANKIVIK